MELFFLYQVSDIGSRVVLIVEDIQGNSVKITFWDGLPGLDAGELDTGVSSVWFTHGCNIV